MQPRDAPFAPPPDRGQRAWRRCNDESRGLKLAFRESNLGQSELSAIAIFIELDIERWKILSPMPVFQLKEAFTNSRSKCASFAPRIPASLSAARHD
jgi:hypothetical protein